jgi:hypothetical protein
MNLCKYKDILGKPGIGFHNHFGTPFALLDIIGTICIAYVISNTYKISYINSFGGLMIIAIFLHKLFCVDTALNRILF